jgi:ergothioneine biosynthesis protein EgtB
LITAAQRKGLRLRAQPEAALAVDGLESRFRRVRALSEAIAAPLSDADATIQPMPDASPAKWHLAHTTWFFESFVLRDQVPGYRLHDERYAYLFNSYYEGEGARHPRPRRGMLSRPSLEAVLAWRAHVDAALADALPSLDEEARALVLLGTHHEEQHQELMLTDMLATFAENPLAPAVWNQPRNIPVAAPEPIRWVEGASGIVEIGHDGSDFAFDCEGPRHAVLLHPHALADRPVTNSEWRAFMDDGGYRRPELWLSDGWDWVNANGIEAPLYWRHDGADWAAFALDGLHPIHPAAPASQISHYEADAFARWAGARLPTEGEWEAAATKQAPSARVRRATGLSPGCGKCSAMSGNGR